MFQRAKEEKKFGLQKTSSKINSIEENTLSFICIRIKRRSVRVLTLVDIKCYENN
jgi:hypothetical protein